MSFGIEVNQRLLEILRTVLKTDCNSVSTGNSIQIGLPSINTEERLFFPAFKIYSR